jgi:hypothetical protein
MPSKPRESSRNSVEQEGRIQLAIQSYQNREIQNNTRLAKLFEVPRGSLRDRLKGQYFQPEIRNHQHRLNETQEESLLKWIEARDKREVAPRPSHVRQMADIILREDSKTPPKPIGKNWVAQFVNRHESLKTRFARRYNYQRALCEDPWIIKDWFKRLKEVQNEHGILDEDIYNFDETGFAMGLIATTKVVTRSNMPGRPHLIQPGQREWVTTIECIGSTGFCVPPCIIFKGKVHIQGWFEEPGLPRDWRI